jgi:hypothetical protein
MIFEFVETINKQQYKTVMMSIGEQAINDHNDDDAQDDRSIVEKQKCRNHLLERRGCANYRAHLTEPRLRQRRMLLDDRSGRTV